MKKKSIRVYFSCYFKGLLSRFRIWAAHPRQYKSKWLPPGCHVIYIKKLIKFQVFSKLSLAFCRGQMMAQIFRKSCLKFIDIELKTYPHAYIDTCSNFSKNDKCPSFNASANSNSLKNVKITLIPGLYQLESKF